jgi:hypothetical protein
LSALKGVSTVAFDCKVATLTMAAGSTLTEKEVVGALKTAGFESQDFAANALPMSPVVVARLATKGDRFDAALSAKVEAALARALPKRLECIVAADGQLIARLPVDAKLDVAATTEALKRELAPLEVELKSLTDERWPATATRAVVVVKRAHEGSAGAIASLPHVLAVLPRDDGKSFVLFTREPCANLADRVREKFAPLSIELDSVEQ